MRGKNPLLLLGVVAFAVAPILTDAQVRVDRPGSRQPSVPTTPRIRPLPEAEWTDVHRQLVAKFSTGSRADNALRTLLHIPPLVESVMPFAIYLSDESTLSARHRELLILRTAWLCGNQAIWSSHVPRGKKAGLTAREIHRIAEGPDAADWDPFEATLLRLAGQLYRNTAVNDATWNALTMQYDVYNLLDAMETVGHFALLSMLYNSFGVQPDEGTTDRFPRDVPYRVAVPEREPPLTVARIDPATGDGLAFTRIFARHPRLRQARGVRATLIGSMSNLEVRERELLILRTGWNGRSEYEWSQHLGGVTRAQDYGLDPVRVGEGPEAPGWNPLDRALLRAVDDLYRDAMVSDTTWDTLSEHLDTAALMAAVYTSSMYRTAAMAMNALGVQVEPGKERFPLPTR